jgi:hypothetical protein
MPAPLRDDPYRPWRRAAADALALGLPSIVSSGAGAFMPVRLPGPFLILLAATGRLYLFHHELSMLAMAALDRVLFRQNTI